MRMEKKYTGRKKSEEEDGLVGETVRRKVPGVELE